ncbi:Oidioi.mRNA.OKI2018_I69.PAR.g12124.t1.cds [Oikopleura dioica]|uniref:protein-serine/threonine phosphatase n=1 Tax=Oikopleura dioica TaxID=34765 RepID=A0ABN7S381_OIKDI|nr:Oidioi.mRNA.OKI2018_I69.PAR.g12124.t1.cds [Oikopleura dioica]
MKSDEITNRIKQRRRSSLVERGLTEQTKQWAGSAVAARLSHFDGKSPKAKLPEHRITMEDADLCVPKLPPPLEEWSLFAVFDGHGGDETANRAAEKDKEQLEQPVSCLPDVHYFERSSEDEYIVMACDGVYDVVSNDELVVLVRSKFAEKESIVETVEEIVDVCLNRGSIDNMTIILIAFETVFNKDIDAVENDIEPDDAS